MWRNCHKKRFECQRCCEHFVNNRYTLMKYYRTGWISDVHLGTRGSKAAALLNFLRETEFETLYVVGDLIDIWALRRAIYWPQEHNDVVQKLLRKGRKGTEIIYIIGNHDEFPARLSRQLREHDAPTERRSPHCGRPPVACDAWR